MDALDGGVDEGRVSDSDDGWDFDFLRLAEMDWDSLEKSLGELVNCSVRRGANQKALACEGADDAEDRPGLPGSRWPES